MRIFLTIFLYFLLTMTSVVLDRSFFAAIQETFIHFNLLLALSIYLLIVIDKNLAFITYASGTIIGSLMGNTLSITTLLVGILVLFIMDRLFESFLTNRSYYTLLLLGVSGWFFYYMVFYTLVFVYSLVSPEFILPIIRPSLIIQIVVGSLALITFLSLAYVMTTFFSKKFKSYFIISD